jgi:hypothetical protein
MNAATWIQILILGGLAGALGQTARSIVGIKKINDAPGPETHFVASRLVVSLIIGFVAGALAAVIMEVPATDFDTAQILGLAATGYAGTDFVEGIIGKVTPTGTTDGASTTTTSTTTTTAVPAVTVVQTSPPVRTSSFDGYLG